MNELETVIDALRAHKSILNASGVLHVAVFGSTARKEQSADSDIDVLLDLDETQKINVFDYVALKEQIREILGGGCVDVVTRQGLKKTLKDRVEKESINAF